MFRLPSCLLGALFLHYAVLQISVHSNPPIPVSSRNDESISVNLTSWVPPAQQVTEALDTYQSVVKEEPQEVAKPEEGLAAQVPPKPVETPVASPQKLVPTPQTPVSKPIVQAEKKKKQIKQAVKPSAQKSPKTKAPVQNVVGKAKSATPSAAPVITKAAPVYHDNPKPIYPPLAKRRGWEGTVLLLVEVLKSGDSSDIQIKQSSGFMILDKAAVKAVKNWKFTPGLENGTPQTTVILVPVRFSLRTN